LAGCLSSVKLNFAGVTSALHLTWYEVRKGCGNLTAGYI
jgi:hypothetical protein